MRRNVSLAEISDGRLYGRNDMVKADCHGCEGCADCCRGMGNSVILDPFDLYRMEAGLEKNLQTLLEEGMAELNVVDGCVLPNLKMKGQRESCAFLDTTGRCSIHKFRPGVCRLFPLGRYYENGDFKYILQVHECKMKNRSKVKAGRWIDTPQQEKYHEYICQWHYLLKDLESLMERDGEEDLAKQVNMALLQVFYLTGYDMDRDFYEQFYKRYMQFVQTFLSPDTGRETEWGNG